MKLIHTADLHLDSKMKTVYSEEKAKQRRQELLEAFRDLVRFAGTVGAEGVLISGDLFDRNNVSVSTVRYVLHVIRENPEIGFYYLRGNHDALFSFGEEELPENLHLFSEHWRQYRIRNVRISGCELVSEADLEEMYRYEPGDGTVDIVMLHAQMNEYAAKGAVTIALRDLRGKGIRYLALGHIHAMSAGKIDDLGQFVYCGCPEPRGFDEPGEHGFCLMDIDEETKAITVTFEHAAKRELKEVIVDAGACESQEMIVNRAEDALKAIRRPEDQLVRVVLTGDVEEDRKPDVELIRQALEGECFALRIEDKTKVRIDYKSAAYEVSLKGELLRLLEASDLTEEKKEEIFLCALRALSETEAAL